ncbi:Uncharacterised protein [Vibrio cholerae]|nr:Uncharacterised protein [Vibrio cholerae]
MPTDNELAALTPEPNRSGQSNVKSCRDGES